MSSSYVSSEKSGQTERRAYLDNLRSFVIFIVVVHHVFYYWANIEAPYTALFVHPDYVVGKTDFALVFQYAVYPWFMALMFVIAGISAVFSLEKRGKKAFVKNRLHKLLVPSTLGVLAIGWISGAILRKNAMADVSQIPALVVFFIDVLSGTGALWFCQILFFFCAVLALFYPLVQKIQQKVWNRVDKAAESPVFLLLMAFVFAGFWLCSKILNVPVVTVYRFGIYGFCFACGYFVFSRQKVIDVLAKFWLPLLALCIAFFFVYFAKYRNGFYAKPAVMVQLLYNVYAFSGVLAALAIGCKFFNRQTAFNLFCKKYSFGVYVFHCSFLVIAIWFMLQHNLPLLACYCLGFVFSLGASLLFTMAVSKVPFVRFVLLGIKKGKVNE